MRENNRLSILITILLLSTIFAGGPGAMADPVPEPPGPQPTLQPFISSQPELAPGLFSTEAYTLSTLNRINYHRDLAGVAPVALDSKISAAAQAHAEYLNVHNITGHYEAVGAEGFTGYSHSDRMTYQGYSWGSAGEVISFGDDAQAGVDALIMAIYHRFIILSSGYPEVGIGDAPHPSYTMCQVIDFGRPLGVAAPSGKIAIYPADGQTEVPTTFNSDTESPDPAPDAGLVGYPVSIQFSTEQSVTFGSFTLSDKGGAPVEVILLKPGSNDNMKIGTPNYALIPTVPLQSDSTYTATFSATVNGNPSNTSWSFTTILPSVLAVTPNPATFALGQTGELVISGSSGSGYQVSWGDGSKLALAFVGDTMVITPKATGSTTITLTDNGTQAKVQIPVTIINGPVSLSGSRALGTGWNLIALPLTPPDPAVKAVINDISAQVISVWKWNGATWAVYLAPPVTDDGAQYAIDKGFDPLQNLDAGEGFWVNANSPATFKYTGLSPANAALTLSQGWNLVGLKTMKDIPVGDIAYPSGTSIISLWAWIGSNWSVTLPPNPDGGASYAASKGFSLLQTISPGQGFWVNVQ